MEKPFFVGGRLHWAGGESTRTEEAHRPQALPCYGRVSSAWHCSQKALQNQQMGDGRSLPVSEVPSVPEHRHK